MHASNNFIGFARPRAWARVGAFLAGVAFAVSAATSHGVDGHSIHSWGSDTSFVVSNRPAGTDFVAIAAGSIHSVALKTDGSVVAWGDDLLNQVSSKPNDTGFTAVSAGGYHSMALRGDGSIVVWGIDDYGQVTNAPAATGFKAIAAGYGHNLALEEDGSIVAWGWDSFGQVSETPAGTGFKAIAAGQRHSLAIEEDGSLVAWGWDDYGLTDESVVPDGSDFIAVVAGVRYCLALRADGTLAMWGDEAEGLIANMPADIDFIAIAGGDHHCIALKADGSLVSWGRGPEFWSDNDGLLSDTPTGTGFVAIAAGSEHSVALGGEFPPVPTITSPENGAIISPGTNMQVVFTLAGDHAAASRVELWKRSHYEEEYSLFLFYEDLVSGQWPPFEFSTGLLADAQGGGVDGSHSLRVRARNTGGQFSDSEPVSITVGAEPELPTLSITSPLDLSEGASVHASGEPITIKVSISGDASLVERIKFYAGSTLLGEDTTEPYEYTWSDPSPGEHSLSAVASFSGVSFDRASPPVSILVVDSEGPFDVVFLAPEDRAVIYYTHSVDFRIALSGDISGLEKVRFKALLPRGGGEFHIGDFDVVSADRSFFAEWVSSNRPGAADLIGDNLISVTGLFRDGEDKLVELPASGSVIIDFTDCFIYATRNLSSQSFTQPSSPPGDSTFFQKAVTALQNVAAQVLDVDLNLFRNFRDEVLHTTPAGRYYVDVLERATPELFAAVAKDTGIVGALRDVLIEWTPVFEAIVNGVGGSVPVTDEMVANALSLLSRVRAVASPELLAILDAEEAALDPSTWAGRTGAELLSRGESQVRPAPGIASQPAPRAIAASGRVSFSVSAVGAGPFTYQWRRNGVDIAGATNATLELPDVQGSHAGSYSVVVSNPFGSTTSSAAALSVNTAARLINLSARAFAGAGDATLVLGFYIEGTGSKTLLIRGVGPKLLDYSVPSVVEDPSVVVYSGSTPLDSNDDWDPALAADFPLVGAFELDPGSKDAALKITLPPGGYTIHLVNPGAVAEALIEVYDFSKDAGTRLVNLSCRLHISLGEIVIVGTSLINNPVPVVVRNSGPALGEYNVDGFATDTHLRVYAGQTEIGANDDWDEALEPDFAAVGAFSFTRGSKDAAIRVPLSQGGITVHATVVEQDGVALVEIYEGK